MVKKINSFIVTNTNGDYEIQVVYSIIDENGEYLQKNIVKNIFVVNKNIAEMLNDVVAFLKNKIPDTL